MKQIDVRVDIGAATLSLWLRHDERYREDYLRLVCTSGSENFTYDMKGYEFNQLLAAMTNSKL